MPKEKPTLCPKCRDPKLTLWHNIGVGKKGPYENYKCACSYIEWVDLKKVPGTKFEKPEYNVSSQPGVELKREPNGIQILADEIIKLREDFNNRMDALGEYLSNHLK